MSQMPQSDFNLASSRNTLQNIIKQQYNQEEIQSQTQTHNNEQTNQYNEIIQNLRRQLDNGTSFISENNNEDKPTKIQAQSVHMNPTIQKPKQVQKKKKYVIKQIAESVLSHFKNTSSEPIDLQRPSNKQMDSTNLYLTFKSLYLKSFDSIKIISKEQNKPNKDSFIQAIKDQEVLISMRDIHIQHNDYDFWKRQGLMALYGVNGIESNKNNHLDSSKQQNSQEIFNGQEQNMPQSQSKHKNALQLKQQFVNKNLQSFLQTQSDKLNSFTVNNYLLASLTFPQKLKRSFCLYNRTKNQQKLYTTTNYQFNHSNLGRPCQQQGDQLTQIVLQKDPNKKNIIDTPGQLFQNQDYQRIYFQKLQSCKSVAHSYVFSGYGYRRYLSHGFQMSMYKYRSYLTSMLRVVFRQLEKFVFESQTYKKRHNINELAQDQFIYHPPEDKAADNPRERVPYRQFQCLVRPLYHVDRNFQKHITQTWHNIFKITFSLGQQKTQNGEQVVSLQDKPEQKMTQDQIVDCYQAIRKKIKQVVNQRMRVDMERMGLTKKIKNKKTKTKLQQGQQEDSPMYHDDDQDQDQTPVNYYHKKKKTRRR